MWFELERELQHQFQQLQLRAGDELARNKRLRWR
jgi:hypothetical protein